MKWTEWYPHARPGEPPLPNGFSYRYRVLRRSEPVRVETFGPFEVSTIASYFFSELYDGKSQLATMGEFTVKHRGEPVTIESQDPDSSAGTISLNRADEVAGIGGAQPALLVHFVDPPPSGTCYLLSDTAGTLNATHLPGCGSPFNAVPLTSLTERFRKSRDRLVPRGNLDRLTLAKPGLYLVYTTALDTRRFSVHKFDDNDDVSIANMPPLAASPDERSFARYVSSNDSPALLVTDVIANHNYVVPIDPARMRYKESDALNPAWVTHHFEWQRGSNGVDSLVERKNFVPIPYRGDLSLGDFPSYELTPAGEPLRDALIEFLATEMDGERLGPEPGTYEHRMKVNGQSIRVGYATGYKKYVSVTLERGSTEKSVLEAIAKRFDAALATGKYDAMFGR
jgi:hypothetical protein